MREEGGGRGGERGEGLQDFDFDRIIMQLKCMAVTCFRRRPAPQKKRECDFLRDRSPLMSGRQVARQGAAGIRKRRVCVCVCVERASERVSE